MIAFASLVLFSFSLLPLILHLLNLLIFSPPGFLAFTLCFLFPHPTVGANEQVAVWCLAVYQH